MGVGVLFPLGIPIAEDKGRSFCSPGRADPEVMGGAETVSGSEWSRTTGDSIPAVWKKLALQAGRAKTRYVFRR